MSTYNVMRVGFCTRFGLLLCLLGLIGCSQAPEGEVRFFQQDQFPSKLSDWGLFSIEAGELRLHAELQPYDLNSTLFTDYAHKLRTLWIPASSRINYAAASDLQLPIGAIVSKTFYYPRDGQKILQRTSQAADFTNHGLDLRKVRLIETRLMVRLADGWHGLPYVWNEAQDEAILEITGAVLRLELHAGSQQQSLNYVVPNVNQCKACHVEDLNSGEMGLIGPKVRHLNKAYAPLRANPNQLLNLQTKGWLGDLPPDLPKNVVWQDDSQKLDDRARSYLDINCGHCHNPSGAADTSGLFLHRGESRPLRLGVCKPPVAAGQGTGGRLYGIKPGEATASILTYRMQSLDLGAMMPELGRSLVHDEGLALVNNWIDSQSGSCDD